MVIVDRLRRLSLLQQQQKQTPKPVGMDFSYFSEDHLRFLAESLPEIVWTAQPDGRHDYMNTRWFQYTGLTERETYLELKTAIHPDDYGTYLLSWKEAVLTGKPYEIMYRFRRASDGMYRWHIGRALPVRNREGQIVKWFGTCVDIHGQKKAEEQLRILNDELETIVDERTKDLRKEIRQRRRAEERSTQQLYLLQRMLDAFPMAAAATNAWGKVLHANGSFYQLLDIKKTLSGSVYSDVITLLLKRFTSSEAMQTLRDMQTNAGPTRRELVADNGRTYEIDCIPTATAEDYESGFLFLVRDISQEKKIDKAKSEFMSLASHQLRTPLTAVRWALSRLAQLMKGRTTEEEDKLLKRAQRSAVAMAETIKTMLSISRIEAGLHTPSKVDMPLSEFLLGMSAHFADAAAEKGIALTIDCPPNMQVHTDPAMLREIIENLLTNAIKYTPSKGTVSLTAEQQESGQTVIRVRDTGVGIPMHQQPSVFSKFFRGENILKIDTEGTGLGLYFVSQLVSLLGATIHFTSEEGKGTEFTVTLSAI